MFLNTIIAIFLIFISTVVYFINLFSKKEEESVSNTLIFTGLTLIASGVPHISDIIIEIIAQLLKLQISDNEGEYLFRVIIGFALIALGVLLKFHLKNVCMC